MNTGELSLFFEDEQENKGQRNPFDGRRVAPIGTFNISRIKEKLITMGAVTKPDGKLNDDISKFTHYVIMGKVPNTGKKEKLQNVLFHGWDVKVISEQDFMNICNGFYEGYYVNETVGKNFHLTMEHFTKNHVEIMPERNPFLEDNIYVPHNVTHNRYALAQAIGNIGAYANYEIENASEADKSYPIIMLAQETIEKLERGESDEIIQYIERTYNDSKSIRFLYQFISEDELTNWIRQRSKLCGDEHTLSLISE